MISLLRGDRIRNVPRFSSYSWPRVVVGKPIRADYGRHMLVALQNMVWGTWGECGPETPVSVLFLDGATVGAPVQAAHIGLLRSLVRSLEVEENWDCFTVPR